ncbi:hypothetical protein JOY44_26065 (plasmid) [Phormidium sp. CLA17]|uniref:hypothetical protein n=1 Tax=Leptolyngbya sp. Cla-17 TaxID=2803751 RepID=UPI0014914EBD|nr:hypothetical protein [Leptolyngbya sp. Cla-17]MBM0744988.1 hypothetical protein [Leptolyngbya sp. Cla-17]
MLISEPIGHETVDRISIDIEGLREPLEVVAAEEERNLTQMIRFLLKEGLAKISARPARNFISLKPGWIEELNTDELATLATEIISELAKRAQAQETKES